MDVDPDRLLLTNGGAEAIALVAAELRHRSGRRARLRPLPPPPRARPDRPRCSGRTPTTRPACWPRPTSGPTVWDEAFYPLATGSWTRGDPESLVVGSLTKLLACPGLRVGYVLAPTADGARTDRRPPAGLGGERAGRRRAARAAGHRRPGGVVAPDRRSPAPTWSACSPSTAWPPAGRTPPGCWSTCRLATGRPTGRPAAAAVARPSWPARGVLVRDCASFGMPDTVRIAVPAPADRGRLARALDQVLPSAARPPTPSGSTGPSPPDRLERPPTSDRKRSVILQPLLDAVLVDLGGTVVVEAPPGTPVADLQVELRPGRARRPAGHRRTTCGSARSPTPPS